MIIYYKVTFHRLDIDDYQVYGYPSLQKARDKFNELLAGAYDSDIPFDKYVLRLGEVHVGDNNGFYDDRLVEIS